MTNTTAVPDLPALPDGYWSNNIGDCYTADQMREYARAAIATQPAPSGDAVEVLREAARRFLDCVNEYIDIELNFITAGAHTEYDRARSQLQKAIATASRATTVAKDGGKTGTRPAEAFAYANKVVNDKMLPQFRGQPKPEASAANQQAGESIGEDPEFQGLLIELRKQHDGSTWATERAIIACADEWFARRLAAPISEGTGKACPGCHGKGDSEADTCADCDGSGKAAPAACNGDALPTKPEPCKQVLPLGWIRYTPDQMDAYVLADRAARAGTGSAGSDAGIAIFFDNFGGDRFPTRVVVQAGETALAYIDTRATKVETAPGNAGEGEA